MIQTSGNINNNPNPDNCKRQIITELKHREESQDYFLQYMQSECTGNDALNSENLQLAFLESAKSGSKLVIDMYDLDVHLRCLKNEKHNGTNGSHQEPKNANNEFIQNIYKLLPFYSSWFDFDKIHQIEKQNLAEFFGEKPSKSPKIYSRIRNFFIQLYWKNPRVSLSATTARRSINGDACSVLRVHSFLESWGLINTQSKTKLVGSSDSDSFEFPQFELPKSKTTLKTTHKETPFDLSVMNFIYKKCNIQKPKCIQCQSFLQLFWYAKSITKNHENSSRRAIEICQECYKTENYPIFYSLEDFKLIKLVDIFENICGISLENESKIDDYNKVLKILSDSKLEKLKIADLLEFDPNISEESLLIIVLKVLEVASNEELKADLDESSKTKKLDEKMDIILNSFSGNFSKETCEIEIGKETNQKTKNECSLKSLFQFNTEITESYEKYAAKLDLKLRFFGDLEKIIYHEKQNLKLFN